jgi:hypothetical protein
MQVRLHLIYDEAKVFIDGILLPFYDCLPRN